MELDPILIVRDVNNREDLVLLRTFDDVRSYLGADREGPKMGVVKLLAKADCPSKARSAVEDFTRWARLTRESGDDGPRRGGVPDRGKDAMNRSLFTLAVIVLLVVGAVFVYRAATTQNIEMQQDAHAPKMP